MSVADIIREIEALDPEGRAEVQAWLNGPDEESDELLAAIDEGIRSLEEEGANVYTREELMAQVEPWAAGRSR